uniref:Immunoglobulin V-set domain-containing protein n=1 Tax=Oncorhynchus mykiss TaxID=8022 RepID=A0A8C7Q4R9_ONCMY
MRHFPRAGRRPLELCKHLTMMDFLCCDAKLSKFGAHGYEGGALDIECSYPDGYQYKPKYLCRHPCSNSDILIRSVKGEAFVPVGRFSVYDNVHGCTFIVSIQNLELQDSGHYYCGLDKWGRDVLTKVEISVSKDFVELFSLCPWTIDVLHCGCTWSTPQKTINVTLTE